jgi:hypothetical protein
LMCRPIRMKIFQCCCDHAQLRPQWEQQQPSQQTLSNSKHPNQTTRDSTNSNRHGRQLDVVKLNHQTQQNARSLAQRARPSKLNHRPRYRSVPYTHSTTQLDMTIITDNVTLTETQTRIRKTYV